MYAILAATGVVLAAVYLLWAYQRMFTGPITVAENRELRDLRIGEVLILAPMIALVLLLGIYPKPALDRIQPSVESILERIEEVTDYEVVRRGGDVVEGMGSYPLPVSSYQADLSTGNW